jgi:hypothetical protein
VGALFKTGIRNKIPTPIMMTTKISIKKNLLEEAKFIF